LYILEIYYFGGTKYTLRAFISVTVFPNLKQNFNASTLFTEFRHLDNRRENVAPLDKS
jgi:hypothetical protein